MLKRRAARFAFHLLRRFPRLAQTFLPWTLTHMSFALPLHKLRETLTLLAFYHPQPSYPVHILIVPRRAIASLADLTAQNATLLAEVILITQSLVEELGLEKDGYRLIVNGGAYQDLPQLHWHLVAGRAIVSEDK
jgi:histidine triad (HIT) family protein